jgi:hypothetical protein
VAINVPIITTFSDKGVNAAQKAFGSLSKSTLIAGTAIAGATVAVAAFAYKSIQKASDFNEAISKNAVVFGAISKEVENFAQTANRALGLSETAALKAAGTFATFGKSAGLAGKDLSDFSTSLVTMAADLASFNNTSVDEAINALGSALRGEAEPLRKYGVLLDDATLKAAATELGIYSGNKALTAQQKVLAAQKVIFDQTADAQGDFSRTSTGLAAQQKILGATLENIQTNLGQAFLPIFLKAVKFFNDKVTPAFERVAEVIGEKGIVKGLQQAIYEMGNFGPKVVAVMKTVAVAALVTANAVGYIGQAANMAWQELKQLFSVKSLVTGLLGPIGNLINAVDSIRGEKAGTGGFKQLFDIEGLKADFDKFSAGIQNFGKQSDYSSFAAKKLAEDAEAAANNINPPGGGGVGGAAEKAAARLKKMQEATKDAAAALTDRMNTALDNAKRKLADAQEAFDGFGKSISDSLGSSLNFADAKNAGKETGASFLTGLRDQTEQAKNYGSMIGRLIEMGISQDALQAVLDAGSESGAAIAAELINGGSAAIDETNALVKASQTAADMIGKLAAAKWYGAGVSNAQAYLDGIQAAFNYAQTGLATPGLNLADIKGIGAAFDSGMAGPSVSSITSGRSFNDSFGGIGGYGEFTVNVQGGISTSAEIGEAVVNAIRAYNRAAGPANIAVS